MIPHRPNKEYWDGFYEALIVVSEMKPCEREEQLIKFRIALDCLKV